MYSNRTLFDFCLISAELRLFYSWECDKDFYSVILTDTWYSGKWACECVCSKRLPLTDSSAALFSVVFSPIILLLEYSGYEVRRHIIIWVLRIKSSCSINKLLSKIGIHIIFVNIEVCMLKYHIWPKLIGLLFKQIFIKCGYQILQVIYLHRRLRGSSPTSFTNLGILRNNEVHSTLNSKIFIEYNFQIARY